MSEKDAVRLFESISKRLEILDDLYNRSAVPIRTQISLLVFTFFCVNSSNLSKDTHPPPSSKYFFLLSNLKMMLLSPIMITLSAFGYDLQHLPNRVSLCPAHGVLARGPS